MGWLVPPRPLQLHAASCSGWLRERGWLKLLALAWWARALRKLLTTR